MPAADTLDEHDRLRLDGFLAPEIAQLLVGLALDIDGIGRNSEVDRNIRYHRRRVRRPLGLLGDDRRIDIHRPPALLGQQSDRGAQQHATVGTFVARIGIGKMAADVAQRDGAEQRIGNRVQ